VRHRVWLLGDTLNLGGTEGQFAEVACRLNRARWDVTVGCVRAVGPLVGRLERAGVMAGSYGPRSFKSPRAGAALLRLARKIRAGRPDIVHSFELYSNLLGVLAARLARVPVIIASQREIGDLRSAAERTAFRIAFLLATHVVVNSEAVADAVPIRGGQRDRVILVRNGVDTSRFAPSAPRRQDSSKGALVGTVGNLRHSKGLYELVHAMALVHEARPEARCAIWGDGPLRPELETHIRQRDLTTVIELRGPTSRPEDALRELDVFVHASVSEGCSNALLEAMATGLPIVATRIRGTAAVVTDEESALLVTSRDPEELAKAIMRVVDDRALAERLGKCARDRARADFDIERSITAMEAAYERAMRETAGLHHRHERWRP